MSESKACIQLVLGGISSGKSEFAEALLSDIHSSCSGEFYYFTPAGMPEDEEMKEKVAVHQERRPEWLVTVECGTEPVPFVEKLRHGDTLLFDSVGTLVGRLLAEQSTNPDSGCAADTAMAEFRAILRTAESKCLKIIFVAEEVGMDLVALSASGRSFQKTMGLVNQLIAAASDEVFFVVAGIAQKLKGRR